METEKCSVCGASVKKENLTSHYAKVHPRKIASLTQPKTLTEAGRRGSVFRSHRRRNILVLSLVVLAVIGVSFAAASYDRGIHWHPVFSITSNTGGTITIPAQIGIDQSLWKDHSLDQYGIGMSPLHTHDTSGKIHEEANTSHHDFTLHELLAIWGEPSDGSAIDGKAVVSLTVDGQAQASPTQDVVLKDGQKIVMATT